VRGAGGGPHDRRRLRPGGGGDPPPRRSTTLTGTRRGARPEPRSDPRRPGANAVRRHAIPVEFPGVAASPRPRRRTPPPTAGRLGVGTIGRRSGVPGCLAGSRAGTGDPAGGRLGVLSTRRAGPRNL